MEKRRAELLGEKRLDWASGANDGFGPSQASFSNVCGTLETVSLLRAAYKPWVVASVPEERSNSLVKMHSSPVVVVLSAIVLVYLNSVQAFILPEDTIIWKARSPIQKGKDALMIHLRVAMHNNPGES